MNVTELIKLSLLGICKISRLSVKKLTDDEKYSLLNRENLTEPIQMYLPQKRQIFSQFFCAFLEFTLIFEHFQKKMTLIAYVFPKLRTPKHMVR